MGPDQGEKMGSRKIEYLLISDETKQLTYSSKTGSDLQLVDTEVADEYFVTLMEGQYSHVGDPAGYGRFEITLAVGTHLGGHILISTPNRTPDGVNTPEALTFRLKSE
jgi:hypothetical protein